MREKPHIFFKTLFLLSLTCFALGLALSGIASDTIASKAANWTEFARLNPMIFGAIFTFSFACLVTLGLPGGAIMSVLSGYFYGPAIGFGICLFSTMIGALLIDLLAKQANIKIETRFLSQQRQTAIAFIQRRKSIAPLLIRMVPVLPFYIASLLLTYSGVGLRTNLVATAVGGAPSALAFTIIGDEINNLSFPQTLSILSLFNSPMFVTPSILLIALALAAAFIKHLAQKNKG
ncbi:TVP38/TMEM64 family protein [Gilvimarinus xylanilyticus]|uniref:TVP38/TMEM64 family membrane protein n=1 Tax=Gilvimarinus xylanilyticus TaxID=2944139 RepID=A0A9X2I3L7_9GAMM|nr:VTT domain-containing protein [Gilvimarinus xylanilyticus]MCP8899376.1 VTT domain-containing protein [Gilvimarinus xylanilyticus]